MPASPDRPRSPAGCCWMSSGSPSAIFEPKSSTTIFSEIAITIAMWCSTSSTVRSNSSRRSRTSSRELVDLGVGQTRGGLVEAAAASGAPASARAISTRFKRAVGKPGGVAVARWPSDSRSSSLDRVLAPGPDLLPAARVRTDHHVLHDGERGEQREVLERARDSAWPRRGRPAAAAGCRRRRRCDPRTFRTAG